MLSAAALPILTGRLLEGMRHKARRRELLHHPPLGYGRGPDGDDQLDPDAQAQRVMRLLFDAFERQGSLHGVRRYLVAHDMRLPIRPRRRGRGEEPTMTAPRLSRLQKRMRCWLRADERRTSGVIASRHQELVQAMPRAKGNISHSLRRLETQGLMRIGRSPGGLAEYVTLTMAGRQKASQIE